MYFRQVILIISVISVFLVVGCGAAERNLPEPIKHNWSFNGEDASNPLQLRHNDKILNLLDGIGPVFAISANENVAPIDYDVSVKSVSLSANGGKYECTATVDDMSFSYTIEFKVLDENSVELIVEGNNNVFALQTGTVTGVDEQFKQFNTGERDLESHFGNSSYPAVIFWQSAGIYILGEFDPDYSNCSFPRHRNPSRRSFLVDNPPLSIDPHYGLLTDGSRNNLKERFVIRFSENLWDVYGEIKQQKSEYTDFLKTAVYLDGWFERFCYGKKTIEFLQEALPKEIGLLTTIQHWAAWNKWDGTCPDSWQAPEHTTPWTKYGTADELHEYIDLARSMGKVGLRQNYLYVADNSWSYEKGLFKKAQRSSGEDAWFSNLHTVKPLLVRQETEIKNTFNVNAAFHDQWVSAGTGYPIVNYDAESENPGTVSGLREIIRDLASTTKDIMQGPLLSESMISEYLYGEYIDAGDYCIFGANERVDFAPEYKLRRLHSLAMAYGMGLGYRHYYRGNWEVNRASGDDKYFNSDEELDSYRACTVLYGNGAYLFGKRFLSKSHVLTEFMTVGIAQRYYAFEPIEYIKYSSGGRFRTLEQIIPNVQSAADLHKWYQRFHINYKNGTHVWVNRGDNPFDVTTPENEVITLGKNCWLAYSEDGNLLAYTAMTECPVVAGLPGRVDYARCKKIGVEYANPRTIKRFKDVSLPTVWIDGKKHFALKNPKETVEQMCK
jgi:hypothetical protein